MATKWSDLSSEAQERLSFAAEQGGYIGIQPPSSVDGPTTVTFGDLCKDFFGNEAAHFLEVIVALEEKGLLKKIRENNDATDYKVTQEGYTCLQDQQSH